MKRAPKLTVTVQHSDASPMDIEAIVRRIVEDLLRSDRERDRGEPPPVADRIGA